ncbi:AAA family ATPase [candidate division GN15 bacterium]|nr:AAA family ATPase [candidate division GN15 bacterium]
MKGESQVLEKDGTQKATVPKNRLETGEKGKPDTSVAAPATDSRIKADGSRKDPKGVAQRDDTATKATETSKATDSESADGLQGDEQQVPGRRPTIPPSRSHEMSSLIGRTTRLQLRQRHVVKSAAFISNKGGVGKTHLSTNMAFYLSRIGKQALLIDADLGNSDVTNKLGYYCDHTIRDLLTGKCQVNEMIYSTPLGFDLIAGEPGSFKLANMSPAQKQRFIRAFRDSGNDYDFVLYDLSAGLSATTLDLALAQDYQIIVTTPQDLVAGYACIKAAYYRFQQLEKKMAERDEKYQPRRTFRPFVVLNQVTDFDSGRGLFDKIQNAAKQNLNWDRDFSIEVNFLGVITSDPTKIREAELNHFLYSKEYGASRTGQCMNFLVQNLVRYRDPNNIEFTTKLKRFIDIFMKSVGETKYAQ